MKKPRVGLFLCSCAGGLREAWDWQAFREQLTAGDKSLVVEEHEVLCAPEGRAYLSARIKKRRLSHVVVAACSAREHEATFRGCLSAAGLNPYLLQMANIREHCAWVTPDPVAALAKATAITRAAVARVVRQTPLEQQDVEVSPELAIIGAGVAGMAAAKLCEEAGRRAFLIEASPSIGGNVFHLEGVAPGLECGPCLLSPVMAELEQAEHVEVITDAEVEEIVGWMGKFQLRLRQRARGVDPELCLGAGCDACAEACPVNVAPAGGYGARKAIYVPFAGAIPNSAVVDQQRCVRASGQACTACADACPVGAVRLEEQDVMREIDAGCVLVATGAEPDGSSAAIVGALASSPDVVLWSDFERMLSTEGPAGGKLLCRDGSEAQSVVIVHCVGRSELGYCSGFCCQAALKAAVVLDERGESIAVTHIVSDLMLRGPAGAALHKRALEAGARFVRVPDSAALSISGGPKGCRVRCESPEGSFVVEASLAVAVNGVRASSGSRKLLELLAAPISADGFPVAANGVLDRQATMVDGVYAIGGAAAPLSAAEAVDSGRAAAGAALARVQPGKRVALEAARAEIDADLCGGCRLCVSACPFKACVAEEGGAGVTVNEVLCRGCGSCAVACPGGAAKTRHFDAAQLEAEIREVLRG